MEKKPGRPSGSKNKVTKELLEQQVKEQVKMEICNDIAELVRHLDAAILYLNNIRVNMSNKLSNDNLYKLSAFENLNDHIE